jgi:hypothetical protein
MAARKKLVAETGLTKIKIMLGWELDFRRMMIVLPDNKHIAYTRAINDMLERGWTTHGKLESNIGRWVHANHNFCSPLSQSNLFPDEASQIEADN